MPSKPTLKKPPLGLYRVIWITAAWCAAMVSWADPSEATDVSASVVARRIDERVLAPQASFVDDATYLRRVTLDVTGRVPTVSEVYAFLEESSSSRRATAIERLMRSGVYYRSMATFWRRAWVPQADTREFGGVTDPFEAWLATRLRDGARYDELATEVLTQDPTGKSSIVAGPKGFYDANQAKPENLAASGARGFLGLNLDCAQCHDHPHARWTRQQFWQTAAFFTAASASTGDSGLPRITIPDTEIQCEPVLLTKSEIALPSSPDSVALRQTFVRWMREDGDRLMAKNAVNRLWSHFFGEAIVEPLDDLSRAEFQTGPRAELLAELAELFIASGYDLDMMIKGIVSSQAYRLVAAAPAQAEGVPSERSPEATAAYGSAPVTEDRFVLTSVPVRGLSGEQLFDSLRVAAGLPMDRTDVAIAGRANLRDAFAAEFHVERTHGAERSITQALTLMNGSFVDSLTTADGNPLLASLLASPFLTPEDQIDTVFVAVFGRHAKAPELETVRERFAASPELSPEARLGGLFWALVNSAEFCTNH